MSMSLTGSRGYGSAPTGSKQQLGGYDVHTLNKYPNEIAEQSRRLYGKAVPGLESSLDYTSRLASGDESAFNEMEAPALRQFNEIQGGIASRFSGMGTGARRSSGFGHVQNSAAQQFAETLQSNRVSYRQQAIKDLRAMVQELMGGQEQERYAFPEEEENQDWQKYVGAALPVAGAAAGAYFGGLPGAKLGASVGGAAGKAFF